jgi:Ser/Thr protein kinase RdoA (MazF antagonist)
MDDNFTYMLSGLLNRHFALGRVARFRQVTRGRQSATYELLTAQQNEYLIYLYPPTFDAERLSFMAAAVNRLDERRFSVMPFLKAQSGLLVVPGPQGTQMMVGGNPAGAPRSPADWTELQWTELGQRLAWMHRTLREELPAAEDNEGLADELEDSLAIPAEKLPRNLPAVDEGRLRELIARLASQNGDLVGYVHGDISVDSLLVDADQQLRFILDWGLMRPGVPMEDLFWVYGGICAEKAEAFALVAEGYTALEKINAGDVETGVTRALARRIVEARAGRAPMKSAVELLGRRQAISDAIGRLFS